MTRPLTLLALLLLSGCVLRQSPSLESYDALSGPEHAAQIKDLASAVSERIGIRYPQELVYVDEPRGRGMFGDALRYALSRNNALAIRPDLAGVSLVYALGELAPGQGYLNLRFSDGTAMAQSFTLDRMPLSPTPAVVETALEAPAPEDAEDAEDATEAAEAYPVSTPLVTRQADEETPNRKSGTQGAEDLATGRQNMPLRMAVLSHLPYGWRYTIPDASKREIRVSWPVDASWRDAISVAAEQAGCRPSFDEEARRVTVRTVNNPLPHKVPTMVPALPSPATENPRLVSAAPASLPVSPALSSTAPSADTSAASSLSIYASSPEATVWELKPGSLSSQLEAWSTRAGFQLIWKAPHDLEMEALSVFRGEFQDAVSRLFKGLHKSGNALRVTIYTANNVIEIAED